MKNFFKQPAIILFIGILLIGGFTRMYQFENWLHFELDQARDARVVDEAFQGDFFDLPLLGPKAGGTFLRLGPAYYYLQYASGLVFGDTPSGVAFFVPILSLLAIVAVYLLFRRGFALYESLALTLLFTVSVYVVLYGRFAWNPNLLIFFIPVGLYALLRVVDRGEQFKGRWFLAALFFLTLATQFHFLAFLALPVITAVFLLLKRPIFSWKYWVSGLVIALVLYSPMMLNEWAAGFTNTQEFLGAITEKSSKENHTFLEKLVRNTTEYAEHGIIILTGFEGATMPAVIIEPGEFGTVCDAKCDKGKWYGIAGLILFGLSFLALLRTRFKEAKGNARQADFHDLILIWLVVSFLIFFPLSYGTAPRFYLLVTPVFFILLGILLKNIAFFLPPKARMTFFLGGVLVFVLLNLAFLHIRFDELNRASTEQVESKPDRILKEQIRVTLEQQRAVVAHFKERQKTSGYPIYMFSDPQYRRALKYLLEREGVQNDVLGFSGIYQEGEYYLVLRQRSDYEAVLRKYLESYVVKSQQSFGTLTVFELTPKPEKIQGVRQDFSIVEKPADSKAPPRYTWREFFANQNTADEDDTEIDEQDN